MKGKEEHEESDKTLPNIPSLISVEFEIPKIKKRIKLSMNNRHTIKQYINMFSTKFDTDFSATGITARVKTSDGKKEIQIDTPLRYIIAKFIGSYK